ncbi:helix-turn-helix domain-containing protein [Hymenobacter sp. BT491]|uniref:helix-turn-helix domain-containing protein n=1 Tax=Hymenobacter sp. BT491 TaxID=2766779 RepID=UPI001653D281|nr:helix-turn-helix domain-containing protein [Hymenobacter sp. BT491]MBC6991677.1 helix-turn-helix domain-containing protein [Hymenobacter sp. BT491]
MNNPFEIINARLSNLEALTLQALDCLRNTATAPAPEIGGIELAQQVTRLSKPRLYALVSARGIPHAKRGNKLYFNRADLLAWVNAGKRGTNETAANA